MPTGSDVGSQMATALGLGRWSVDFARGLVFWPEGIGEREMPVLEVGFALASFGDRFVDADRPRILPYIEEIVAKAGTDVVIDVAALGSDRARIPLRLVGRASRDEAGVVVTGLVQAAGDLERARWLARGVSNILEAAFLADSSAVLIFDERMKIRRANPVAHAMFGVQMLGVPRAKRMAAIQAALPAAAVERFAECLSSFTASTGWMDLPDAALSCPWRANPYGGFGREMRGLVVVLAPPPAQIPADQRSPSLDRLALSVLDELPSPIFVVAVRTNLIVVANRAARELAHLVPDTQYRVENFMDLTRHFVGRRPPPMVGTASVTLPYGARITRICEEEYILVEYLHRRTGS